MNCDDTNLSAYLDHELPAPDRRAVEAHLQSCPDCAATLKDLERVRTMLLTQAVPMGLHGPVIDRIRNEEHRPGRRRNAISMAIAAVVLMTLAAGAAIYAFHAPEPGPPDQQAPMIAVDSSERIETERPKLAQDVTGSSEMPTQPQTTALASTQLPLTLTGTLLGSDPQAVLVNNDTGEQHIYRPGDTVLDGVVLREVQQSRVVLDREGIIEVLTKGPGLVATRPSVDGEWQVAVLLDGKIAESGPVLRMSEVNGTVRIADGDIEDFAEGRIEGRTLTVYRTPESVPADLRGDFNNAFTEVVLSSPKLSQTLADDLGQDSTDGHTYAIKLSRFDGDSKPLDSRAIMNARNDEVRAMYEPLKAYAEAHQRQFPGALAQLVPDYVQSLELYADREDRIVTYFPGLELQDLSQLGQLTSIHSGDDAQALLLHEAKLQEFWGGPAPFAATLIEVTYAEPDQVFTLNVQGGVSGRSIQVDLDESATEEVRWQAMIASDQNNLKQLGLVNKMFQNENAGEHVIPGFCTVYPEYMTDPNVLTSPWDEPGTVSYEILFPAAAQEDLLALGIDIVESQGNTDPNDAVLNARAQSEVPIMFNKSDIPAVGDRPASRNVLYLDGHVERLRLDEFQKRVGPFLR